MSKYRFVGSRISKIAFVLDYDLSEAIYLPPYDLCEVKFIIDLYLLHGCLYIAFLGPGFLN